MENQRSEKKYSDQQKSNVSGSSRTGATDGLVEIKQEVDVKLEEDEVDTIEYTPSSNQFEEVFVSKVEKVEPDDSDDGDEVDNPWELFDRFGYLDSFNSNASTMQKSTIEAKTKDTTGSSQNQSSEERATMMQRSRDGVNNDNGTRTVSKSHATTSNHAGRNSMIDNIPKSQSSSLKGRKQHKCTECDHVAIHSGNLKQHMLKHTGEKPFPCKHCPERFKSKQNLQYHMKVHVKKGSLNCSICLEVFVTNTELVEHQSACKQRRYECHLCKKFSTPKITLLKIHMRVHSGVRPFKCDLCSNKFTQSSSLKAHAKTHTNPRRCRLLKFQCSVCARNFFDQSGRDAHELNCKRRRYECYLCQNFMTYVKTALQYHMRMQHTSERPFKCKFCEKSYVTVSILNQHKKTSHSN